MKNVIQISVIVKIKICLTTHDTYSKCKSSYYSYYNQCVLIIQLLVKQDYYWPIFKFLDVYWSKQVESLQNCEMVIAYNARFKQPKINHKHNGLFAYRSLRIDPDGLCKIDSFRQKILFSNTVFSYFYL